MKTINFPHRASPLEAQEQRISPLSRGRLREVLGFTLVELIVVITILAILGTIAFINLQGFAGSARDSARVSDLANITQGLELSLVRNGSVPPPEAPVGGGMITLTASGGGIIGYQGVVGQNTLSIIKMSNAQDPLDKKYYTYTTNASSSSYQLLALFEDTSTITSLVYPLITPVFAGYEARIPTTKGHALGTLLATSGSYQNQPLQEIVTANTTLDIQNFTGTLGTANIGNLSAYFSKSDFIPSTVSGSILSTALQISMNHDGNGFSTPSTCPTGFVAVPGNKEFHQPGFCVAKYEMKYASTVGKNQCGVNNTAACNNGTATTSDRWRTWEWVPGNTPVSIPEGEPIAAITQSGAIAACQAMGAGYHLITNNEWMTIARNIEQQSDNWSTNTVGSGFLYSGNNDDGGGTNSWALPATKDDADGYYMTQDSASGNGDTNNGSCNVPNDTCGKGQKRTLKLSNGQIIWDLSGNVWEHVNGANILDGTNYATMNGNVCGADGWMSFTNNAITDTITQCSFAGTYSYTNQGPKTPSLNANNGIGRIYSYPTGGTNRVFFRGGSAIYGAGDGVFTLDLGGGASNANRLVGFRCAR